MDTMEGFKKNPTDTFLIGGPDSSQKYIMANCLYWQAGLPVWHYFLKIQVCPNLFYSTISV